MYNDFPEKSLSPPEYPVFDWCFYCKGEIYQYDKAMINIDGNITACETCAEEHTEECFREHTKRNIRIRGRYL